MNRGERAKRGQETVEIVQRGWYEHPEQGRVNISDDVSRCLSTTQLYTPDRLQKLREIQRDDSLATVFETRNETTLAAVTRHVVDHEHDHVMCLNFASAKNPGGGFLGGSQAQEESLARSSALYDSLRMQPEYYEANRRCRTALYTDHLILSPNVPVFRDDNGTLLAQPYHVHMLTAPAVNAGAIMQNEPEKEAQIRDVMQRRIENILAVALEQRFKHLVLGAWGCGVFRNEPRAIAALFAGSLMSDERFRNRFQTVCFAVLDHTADEQIYGAFREQFSSS